MRASMRELPQNTYSLSSRRNCGEQTTMTDATRGLTIPAVLRLLGAIGPDYQGFITCPSPDHPDRHPSTHITPDQRGWKCFACNAQGGVLDIIVCYGFAEDRKAAAEWLEEMSA